MFLPPHLASGYLLGKGLKHSPWTIFPFIPVLIFASIIPDVDGVFSASVAGHHSVIHTPIFWITLFGLMVFANKRTNIDKIKPISLGIFLGTQLHLFTDWFTARTVGIRWLYPLSNRDFHLFPIYPENGQVKVWEMISDPYFSFYMGNTFLFWIELGVILSAIGLYINNRLNRDN